MESSAMEAETIAKSQPSVKDLQESEYTSSIINYPLANGTNMQRLVESDCFSTCSTDDYGSTQMEHTDITSESCYSKHSTILGYTANDAEDEVLKIPEMRMRK